MRQTELHGTAIISADAGQERVQLRNRRQPHENHRNSTVVSIKIENICDRAHLQSEPTIMIRTC